MKTGEKGYWGIFLGFLSLIMLGIAFNPGDIKITKTIYNKTTITYISKGQAVLYCLLFWGIVSLILWLIIKAVTGGFSSDKR